MEYQRKTEDPSLFRRSDIIPIYGIINYLSRNFRENSHDSFRKTRSISNASSLLGLYNGSFLSLVFEVTLDSIEKL